VFIKTFFARVIPQPGVLALPELQVKLFPAPVHPMTDVPLPPLCIPIFKSSTALFPEERSILANLSLAGLI
jgi:hypothetical protein